MLSFVDRYVNNVNFPSRRISQVSQSSEEHQSSSSVSEVGACWCARIHVLDLTVVEVLVDLAQQDCLTSSHLFYLHVAVFLDLE